MEEATTRWETRRKRRCLLWKGGGGYGHVSAGEEKRRSGSNHGHWLGEVALKSRLSLPKLPPNRAGYIALLPWESLGWPGMGPSKQACTYPPCYTTLSSAVYHRKRPTGDLAVATSQATIGDGGPAVPGTHATRTLKQFSRR